MTHSMCVILTVQMVLAPKMEKGIFEVELGAGASWLTISE